MIFFNFSSSVFIELKGFFIDNLFAITLYSYKAKKLFTSINSCVFFSFLLLGWEVFYIVANSF